MSKSYRGERTAESSPAPYVTQKNGTAEADVMPQWGGGPMSLGSQCWKASQRPQHMPTSIIFVPEGRLVAFPPSLHQCRHVIVMALWITWGKKLTVGYLQCVFPAYLTKPALCLRYLLNALVLFCPYLEPSLVLSFALVSSGSVSNSPTQDRS